MKFFSALLLFLSAHAFGESRCIAHQGSFKNSPANSLESLKEAIELNADGVEFDINHTKDGVALINHDKVLSTATHLPGKACPLKTPINELNLATIRENCALEFQGNYYPLATLKEALDLLAPTGKMVFIELKDRPTYLTRLTIQNHFQAMPESLRIIAFKVKYLDELIKSDEKSLFWSRVKGLDLDVAPWGTPSEYGVNVWNRLYRLRGKHYQNRESSVWTLKRKTRIEMYLRQNVDFITTDEVEMCLSLKNMLRSME